MKKEHLNYEKNIIESFRILSNTKYGQVSNQLFISDTDSVKQVIQSICDDIQWPKWQDSSGKNEPPPDFYNDELKLMMEVMRVDDNAHIDELTGKLINPVRAGENVLIRELRDKGFLEAFREEVELIITARC